MSSDNTETPSSDLSSDVKGLDDSVNSSLDSSLANFEGRPSIVESTTSDGPTGPLLQQRGPGEKSEEDLAFERMSPTSRMILYICFFCVTWLQVAQMTVILFSWVPTEVPDKISKNESAFILNGLTIGNFIGLFSLRLSLKFFSRKGLWIFYQLLYCLCFVIFATLSGETMSPYLYGGLCFLNILIIAFSQCPIRLLINTLISKLYPKNLGMMIQIMGIGRTLGTVIGPLSAGVFLNYIDDDISILFHFYTFLMLIPSIVGFIVLPKTNPKERAGRTGISYKAILLTWRGFCNALDTFVISASFRIVLNSVAIYLGEHFHKTSAQISFLMDYVNIGGVIGSFGNILVLRVFDHRISHVFATMLVTGVGLILTGGFFETFQPGIYLSVFGLACNQMVNAINSSTVQDLIALTEEITQKEANLASRDTVSILMGFTFSLSSLFGSLLLIYIQRFDFQIVISVTGCMITVLALNYIFASKLWKEGRIFKKKRPQGRGGPGGPRPPTGGPAEQVRGPGESPRETGN